jgi:hypothetical protein
MTFDPSEMLQQYPLELTGLEAWVRARVQSREVSSVRLAGT